MRQPLGSHSVMKDGSGNAHFIPQREANRGFELGRTKGFALAALQKLSASSGFRYDTCEAHLAPDRAGWSRRT